ncbi:MAG: ATP-binding protein [Dehalococcoidia bacterium]
MSEFENGLDYLMAELRRIDLRLRLQVARQRQRNATSLDDQFRGLFISEEEIESLVSTGGPLPDNDSLDLEDLPEASACRQFEKGVAVRKETALKSHTEIRLRDLAGCFNLNQFEVDSLLICLLPEVDTKYERIFGYLHDDVTRRRPTINLALQCLLDNREEKMAARESFLAHSPLIANHLIRLEEDSSPGTSPLLARNLKIDERIANYLLGSDHMEPRLAGYTRFIKPLSGLGSLVLSERLRRQLSEFASRLNETEHIVLYLQGPAGIGRKTAAEALCCECGLPLLTADVPGLLASGLVPETAVSLVLREAKLRRAALCFSGIDPVISEENTMNAWLQTITRAVNVVCLPVFITGETEWYPVNALERKLYLQMEIDVPPYDVRRLLWNKFLNGYPVEMTQTDIDEAADKFRFTPGQIRDAATTARDMSFGRGSEHISKDDLYKACRIKSNRRLNIMARKIEPRYEWEDIVLPEDQKYQLREIADYVKYRHIVFADWNFEQKLSLGKGLNAIFSGPSGTGKTMAAEIISNELGLDLYRIDLSAVVSKYIGETEKNLDRIFTEARNSNAILFFDEADAVFGKRSEVRDSHDRYANIEVAYLLQKMEEYEGIVILATNLKKNIDEAFARRMHFSVEFPQPEASDRLLIWQGMFPLEAPLGDDVDLNFMARQFKITGGNIKNIALSAAFLAASDGRSINMEHLIRATKREYQKVGKLWNETDFGPFFELIKG